MAWMVVVTTVVPHLLKSAFSELPVFRDSFLPSDQLIRGFFGILCDLIYWDWHVRDICCWTQFQYGIWCLIAGALISILSNRRDSDFLTRGGLKAIWIACFYFCWVLEGCDGLGHWGFESIRVLKFIILVLWTMLFNSLRTSDYLGRQFYWLRKWCWLSRPSFGWQFYAIVYMVKYHTIVLWSL